MLKSFFLNFFNFLKAHFIYVIAEFDIGQFFWSHLVRGHAVAHLQIVKVIPYRTMADLRVDVAMNIKYVHAFYFWLVWNFLLLLCDYLLQLFFHYLKLLLKFELIIITDDWVNKNKVIANLRFIFFPDQSFCLLILAPCFHFFLLLFCFYFSLLFSNLYRVRVPFLLWGFRPRLEYIQLCIC